MTKQFDAAVWILDNNKLASFHHRRTSYFTIANQSLPALSCRMSQNWQENLSFLEFVTHCNAHWNTPVQPLLPFCCSSVLFIPTLAPNPATPLNSPFCPFLSFCVHSCLSLHHRSLLKLSFYTEHCIVPCYPFLKASSLSVACDIRGPTEHQPEARGGYCLAVWAWSPVSLGGRQAGREYLPPVGVCWDTIQGHGVNMWGED